MKQKLTDVLHFWMCACLFQIFKWLLAACVRTCLCIECKSICLRIPMQWIWLTCFQPPYSCVSARVLLSNRLTARSHWQDFASLTSIPIKTNVDVFRSCHCAISAICFVDVVIRPWNRDIFDLENKNLIKEKRWPVLSGKAMMTSKNVWTKHLRIDWIWIGYVFAPAQWWPISHFVVACNLGNSGCSHRSIDLLHGQHIVGTTKSTQSNWAAESGDQREFLAGIQGSEKIAGRNLWWHCGHEKNRSHNAGMSGRDAGPNPWADRTDKCVARRR